MINISPKEWMRLICNELKVGISIWYIEWSRCCLQERPTRNGPPGQLTSPILDRDERRNGGETFYPNILTKRFNFAYALYTSL